MKGFYRKFFENFSSRAFSLKKYPRRLSLAYGDIFFFSVLLHFFGYADTEQRKRVL